MALMPESWLNMPMETARNMGSGTSSWNSDSCRGHARHRWIARCPATRLVRSLRRSCCSTSRASSMRCFLTSQRGLRGMAKSIKKNSGGTPQCRASSAIRRRRDRPGPSDNWKDRRAGCRATTLNWKKPTRRPRHFAGAISAIYMGPSTEEPPIPKPPMKRKKTRAYQFQAKAQPREEIRYRMAMMRRLSRRP